MSASFETPDKFSPDQNFSQVKFGWDTDLLETELNEMQKILARKSELLGKALISNGFLQKSALSLVGGVLTVPADTVSVDGKITEIKEDMTISASEGDTIYLSLWDTEVTGTTTLYKSGNLSGGSVVTNDILDSRLQGQESARRIQRQVQLTKSNTDSGKDYLIVASINTGNVLVDKRTECVLMVEDPATLTKAQNYTDNQINLVTATGIPKLVSYGYTVTATADSQTDFTIPLETFSDTTDTVLAMQNGSFLDVNKYSVLPGTSTLRLSRGVVTGTVIGLFVFKNVPIGSEGAISGIVLAQGTTPQDRIIGLPELTSKVADMNAVNQTQSATLKRGLTLITTLKASPMDVKLQGRTLINFLGKDGNCEDTSKWGTSNISSALDSTNFVYGSNSLKITATGATSVEHFSGKNNIRNEVSSLYLLIGKVKPNVGQAFIKAIDWSATSAVNSNVSSSVISDTTKFSTAYVKVATKADSDHFEVRLQLHNGTSTVFIASGTAENANFDGIAIHKIDQATYDKIDVDPEYTGDKLAEKFPYVDSYQTLQNPRIVNYGKNLLPPLNEWGEFNSSYPTTITSPYAFTFTKTNTTVWQGRYVVVPALENQAYSISTDAVVSGSTVTDLYFDIRYLDASGTQIGATAVKSITISQGSVHTGHSFTTPAGTKSVSIRILADDAADGTYTVSNPILNLGSTSLPFEAQDKSYLYVQGMLAEGESMERIDGKCLKTKKINHIVLDGSLTWAYHQTNTGLKSVSTKSIPLDYIVSDTTAKIVKYDGKIINSYSEVWNPPTGADRAVFSSYANGIFVSIASTDSGWGDSYTPTAAEIQAYFMGWRMFIAAGATNVPYNGTGTKAWGKIYCGIGTNDNGVVQNSGITTLPTTMNDQGYTPYQLHYQLATPITEVIPSEGALTLIEGDNQVELGEGIIVREVASPTLGGGYYQINYASISASLLKYRTEKILQVSKNGAIDNHNWSFQADGNGYGKQRAACSTATFDPKAVYTVTYLAQPYQLTAPSPDQTAIYSTNDHTALQKLMSKVEDLETKSGALESRFNASAIEVRNSDPATPSLGRMWLRSDL